MAMPELLVYGHNHSRCSSLRLEAERKERVGGAQRYGYLLSPAFEGVLARREAPTIRISVEAGVVRDYHSSRILVVCPSAII